MTKLSRSLLVVSVAGLAAGCGADDPAGGVESPVPELEWVPCAESPDDECSSLEVPRHWDAPDGEQISVRLLRVRAKDPERRIGSLITHLAGAGSGIGTFLQYRPFFEPLFPELAERFDLVAFDRRGWGGTAPLACVDDDWIERLRKTRIEPETETEWAETDALWKEYDARCAAAASPRGWIGAEQVARDIDRIRAALGDDKTTLLGAGNVGLAIGANAALFPDRLRTAAIDSPVPPPGSDLIAWYLTRAPVYDEMLSELLARCANDPSCEFHGGTSVAEVEQAYDALSDQIRAQPLAVGGRTLGDHDFAEAVANIVSGGANYLASDPAPAAITLGKALAAAEQGDGSLLLARADAVFGRNEDGTYRVGFKGVTPTLQLADHVCPAGFDVTAAKTAWPEVGKTAPRLGAVLLSKALGCLHGQGRDEPLEIAAPSARPLVLYATARSPIAPLSGAEDFAAALGNGTAVVEYAGWGDTVLGRSACIRESLGRQLVDPEGWTPPSAPCP